MALLVALPLVIIGGLLHPQSERLVDIADSNVPIDDHRLQPNAAAA